MPELEIDLLIQPKAVMDKFCWAYSAALVKKLKELAKEKRIFESEEDASHAEQQNSRGGGGTYRAKTIPIAEAVIEALEEQIHGLRIGSTSTNPTELYEGITHVEEFLAIFKKNAVSSLSSGPEDPTFADATY